MSADMHASSDPSRCDTAFLGEHHERNERRTWWVVGLTAVTMVVEIAGGTIYGSMALVADGWHMSTHAIALAIAALAYRYARRHASDPRFTFGTGKVGELAGFASAVGLAIVGVLIAWESLQRLFDPRPISFDEAIFIAVIGLIVNLVSAKLLGGGHGTDGHHHVSGDQHLPAETKHPHAEYGHQHHDSNIRAAYFHVLADALTSVLAIIALLAGRFLGWVSFDPVIGVVGALVIIYWSWGLIRTASHALLDASPNEKLLAAIAERIETGGATITDLHLWRVGPGHNALIVSIAADEPDSPAAYKARLSGLPGLSHVTIEVNTRAKNMAGDQ